MSAHPEAVGPSKSTCCKRSVLGCCAEHADSPRVNCGRCTAQPRCERVVATGRTSCACDSILSTSDRSRRRQDKRVYASGRRVFRSNTGRVCACCPTATCRKQCGSRAGRNMCCRGPRKLKVNRVGPACIAPNRSPIRHLCRNVAGTLGRQRNADVRAASLGRELSDVDCVVGRGGMNRLIPIHIDDLLIDDRFSCHA